MRILSFVLISLFLASFVSGYQIVTDDPEEFVSSELCNKLFNTSTNLSKCMNYFDVLESSDNVVDTTDFLKESDVEDIVQDHISEYDFSQTEFLDFEDFQEYKDEIDEQFEKLSEDYDDIYEDVKDRELNYSLEMARMQNEKELVKRGFIEDFDYLEEDDVQSMLDKALNEMKNYVDAQVGNPRMTSTTSSDQDSNNVNYTPLFVIGLIGAGALLWFNRDKLPVSNESISKDDLKGIYREIHEMKREKKEVDKGDDKEL